MCVLWRLASEIVAGENRLAKFCDVIFTSWAYSCTRKLVCFVRSSPRCPRSANMYNTSPAEVAMWKGLCSHLRQSMERRF